MPSNKADLPVKSAPKPPASAPTNSQRSHRNTPAKEEAKQRRLAEEEEKKQTLSNLLGLKQNGEEISKKDEKLITKLQKELGDVSQAESEYAKPATDIEMSGMDPALPDMGSHRDTTPNTSENAVTETDGESPASKVTEPSVNPQTKPQYSESGTDDSDEERQNLPAKPREFQASSSPAKVNAAAEKARQMMTSANKSKILQVMEKERVTVIEEGYIIVGSNAWMVYGYGLPLAAKYEMEVYEMEVYDDEEELKKYQPLSTIEGRMSILKKENGRRQYNYDNIESLDAVTVLPYGRRKGKRSPQNNKLKPSKPRFRLTLVQVKWKNILPEHAKRLKNGRSWEPRSELLGMVCQKLKAQLDYDIFTLCETQDSRNALWMKENGKAHLKRPKTPLPGNIELVSGRAARQKSSTARSSGPTQTKTHNEQNGKEDKGKKQEEEEGESEDEDDESEEEDEGKESRGKKSATKSRTRIQNANAEGVKAPEPVKFSKMTYIMHMMEFDKIPAKDVDEDKHAETRTRWEDDWPKYKKNMLDAGHKLVEF